VTLAILLWVATWGWFHWPQPQTQTKPSNTCTYIQNKFTICNGSCFLFMNCNIIQMWKIQITLKCMSGDIQNTVLPIWYKYMFGNQKWECVCRPEWPNTAHDFNSVNLQRPLRGMQVYIIIGFIQVFATWASIPATGLFSISQASRQAPFYLNIRHLLTQRPTKNYISIRHIIHKWILFFYSSHMWILPDTLTNVLIINPNMRLYKASS